MARKAASHQARRKTGLPGCPIESGFMAVKYFFQYEVDRKVISEITKKHIRKTYSKEDASKILNNPEYHFNNYSYIAAAIYWNDQGNEFKTPVEIQYKNEMTGYYDRLLQKSNKPELPEEEIPKKAQKPSPVELLRNKVNSTVMTDIDRLEDEWTEGKATDLKLYELFRQYDLKAPAVSFVQRRLDRWHVEYTDAYHKRCPQAVEGYSHLGRSELKRRIKVIDSMLSDLERVRAAGKATRQPRVPKSRASDKQIQKLQYMKESPEYKLVSINPIQVPTAYRLYTFNIKSRVLTELVTSSTKGFEVKGTTVYNIDQEKSRSIKLRKPDEVLPDVLRKTPRQINGIIENLSTNPTPANGRINKDTILLRILDK